MIRASILIGSPTSKHTYLSLIEDLQSRFLNFFLTYMNNSSCLFHPTGTKTSFMACRSICGERQSHRSRRKRKVNFSSKHSIVLRVRICLMCRVETGGCRLSCHVEDIE